MQSLATFSFVVPLSWVGEPGSPDSFPTSWLAADGRPTSRRPGATEPADQHPPISFTFRRDPTMLDLLKIEPKVDEVNGEDPDVTVDLDLGIEGNWRRLRTEIEADLWPKGRPDVKLELERREQERMLEIASHDAKYATRRGVVDRLTAMRERQRVAAEWSVLILDPPEGWQSIADRPLGRGLVEAIAWAYMRARSEAETAAGKEPRSAP